MEQQAEVELVGLAAGSSCTAREDLLEYRGSGFDEKMISHHLRVLQRRSFTFGDVFHIEELFWIGTLLNQPMES